MADNNKITLTCNNPECGKQFQLTTPAKPGAYSVHCPYCKTERHFKVQEPSPEAVQPQQQVQPQQPAQHQQQVQLGFLDNGSYRYLCENPNCRQAILVPGDKIKIGQNTVNCPKCGNRHTFDKEPTQDELLRCQNANCKGVLEIPDTADGVYSVECPECGTQYNVIVSDNKITKVQSVTLSVTQERQAPMKLCIGSLFGKKEYNLTKGTHYVGRQDNGAPSDFMFKDQYASARSLKIDVNQNGVNLVYKMTVIKATNPVLHNSRELTVGDIIYLNYGDTIKIGKTLIRVQKA